ncbi:bifunctional (p)ppGpp synthetase/guanosine-3',5'-bis(diphosphate) 3'-pyrophosphohydrolase [Thiomicrorhabdus sp. Milos-T2]|uniref:RelA/SpoT family protein n=1 Tax=Thiomicrorhabdus sp. Milos-T2 TaxID=90814 RepID=UPI0004949B1A|nr:bifunctional (p)ppGpp synthetase/guanosine-3',5'-bis(diphosphate) 3'-pyrophosphohydrolase [Thiomicrorhabdus sp. Milos-T2]
MNSTQSLYNEVFKDFSLTKEQQDKGMQACAMALEADNLPEKGVVRSYAVAHILANLKLDEETLIAVLISDSNLEPIYPIENIIEVFGERTAKLVEGIRKLNQFKDFDVDRKSDDVQNERLRQMLLAMTTDIRIMIMKLAYRVARLRELKHEEEAVRHQIAAETELIFSPLANRLGIAQLKWELEDLSFRYLHPEEYKDIAHQLQAKRSERENYINVVLETLDQMLKQQNINAKISGRPKHIYSIWKKMNRKSLPIEELYDLRAVRIYVDNVQMCYEALGLIHSRWNYVRHEFDDYITTPKENGYQSIHTVIIGPEGKTVEIQIRTPEMHHNAEYGIAAHWRYKEGGNSNFDENLEHSIANVRQLLESSDDPDVFKEISTELQSKHIYIMTPLNEIITLRQGATPLDFAYQIHTELGHRCRGAKVNGRIQPLSYVLNTGDKVEVLTIKNGEPSRNWLNPNLGYLTSSSARNKVRNWFNKQNKTENTTTGETLFNREIKRLHAENISSKKIANRFRVDSEEALFEDIGKGRINERQLTSAIQSELRPEKEHIRQQKIFSFDQTVKEQEQAEAYVIGAIHLKTNLAPCCSPKPFDDIVGFVTRGRGITVHRHDCANILNLSHDDQRRIIEVSWNKAQAEQPSFTAELQIVAFDRKGLLRDVMTTLTELDINLISSQTKTNTQENSVLMNLTLELDYSTNLGDLLDYIEIISNVESVSIKTD